jgi:hypothetical protein
MFSKKLNIDVLEHQAPHIDNITKVLMDELYGVIDVSTMGNGKTYTTTYIAHQLNLPMVVICPSRIVTVWENMRKIGAVIHSIHSYETMRNAGKSFPYLIKDNNKKYHTTDEWNKLVDKGIMLVFDESHRIKNPTANQTQAAIKLVLSITGGQSKSRYMFLSATPYDTEKHIEQSYKALGYTSAEHLTDYNIGTKERNNKGIIDVVNNALNFNDNETENVLNMFEPISNSIKAATVNKIAYELFIRVYKKKLIYSMISPNLDKDVGTLYGNMTELEYARYKMAVNNLSEVVLFNEDTGDVGTSKSKDKLARLSLATRDLEHVKAGIFARQTANILNSNPNAKVIIAVTYNSTIPMIMDRLLELVDIRPLIINGEPQHKKYVEESKRVFQEFNNHYRLLIINIASGAEGISLHDMEGSFPRTMLISPSYSIYKLHQASGRIVRVGAKSVGTVRIIYGKSCHDSDVDVKEQRIADALTRKTKVMASLLDQAVKDGVKFPGEYEPIVDPEQDLNVRNEVYPNDKGFNRLDLEVVNGCLSGQFVCLTQNGDNDPKVFYTGDNVPSQNYVEEEDFTYGDDEYVDEE